MARRRNISQAVNQAIWALIEDLDVDGKYGEESDAVKIAPMVERIAKVVIRELPDDLKR